MIKICISYKNKLTLVAGLLVVVLAGYFALKALTPTSSNPTESILPGETDTENTETNGFEQAGYPPNLLEGNIIDIDSADELITILADFSKITTGLGAVERTIDISEAEIVVYDLDTQKESSADLGSLKVGDGILVATEELNYEAPATREEYTAVKITKMVKNNDDQ